MPNKVNVLLYTESRYIVNRKKIKSAIAEVLKEQEFIRFVQENPNVIYSASYDGKFDIAVSIWAKNVEELAESLKEMEAKFEGYIAERQMATIIRGEYCVRDYLVNKKSHTKRKFFFGSTPFPFKIDVTDKKILLELGNDARVSSVDIANELNLSADAIYKRIKKLESTGIIQNYNIVPNEESYPYIHYKLLISLQNLNAEKERRLHEYCRMQSNIWYFCTTLGPWNFEIDLDVENQGEFRHLLREVKINFSDIIKDYTVMTAFRTNKYNFCPSLPK
ncbi:Lrp/AsnC family transcriptional regulator [Candidatus Woesearchaeota archaeon]|nr:Lrp/AsnC family transcriptional regulator [Candidatus Woesearchaeota archaeon]